MSYLKDLLGDAYKEGMSEDEISKALETAKVGAGDKELDRMKTALSKANSEAADYKKQLRSKQTEDEKRAADAQAEHDKLVEDNKNLSFKLTVIEKKAKFLAMGYDDALAQETAEAMANGDMDTVLANQAKWQETHDKAVLADAMRKTPRPDTGGVQSDVNFAEKAQTAQQNGNWAEAAYYTRLAEEQAGGK